MKSQIEQFLLNEITLDRHWRKKLNIGPLGINYRPLKYKKLNSTRFGYYFFLLSWPVILGITNIYFFLTSLKRPYKNIELLIGQSLWLESSNRSIQIRTRENLNNLSVIDLRTMEFFSYITRRNRMIFLFHSLKTIWFGSASISVSDKLNLVDYYRVYSFHKFIFELNQIAHSLSICNHSDRWAMACYDGFLKGVSVWQHGIQRDEFHLPVKLKNISTLHCISHDSFVWWEKNIINHPTRFVVQSSKFILTEGLPDFDLLVVSNPAYIDEEIGLLLDIVKNTSLKRLGYKPHPAYGKYKSKLNLLRDKGIYILDKTEYPKTNLVLHRNSTLADEYKSIGINGLNCDDKTNDFIINILKS